MALALADLTWALICLVVVSVMAIVAVCGISDMRYRWREYRQWGEARALERARRATSKGAK